MIMDREEFKSLVDVLISELDRDLSRHSLYIYQRDLFEQLSYEKWALKELLEYVSKRQGGLYSAVEEFCKQMNEYSCRNKKTSRMFSAAYDAAMNILDVIIKEEEIANGR